MLKHDDDKRDTKMNSEGMFDVCCYGGWRGNDLKIMIQSSSPSKTSDESLESGGAKIRKNDGLCLLS